MSNEAQEVQFFIEHVKNSEYTELPFLFKSVDDAKDIIKLIKSNQVKIIGDHEDVFHIICKQKILIKI